MGVVSSLTAVGGIAYGSMIMLSASAIVALGGVLLAVDTKGTAKSEERSTSITKGY